MKKYVVGFMFSGSGGRVVLIRKNKPDWQNGKLNGVGGKVDFPETTRQAMVREFKEETGKSTNESDWKPFHTMSGQNDDGAKFELHCFAAIDFIDDVKTMEEEQIVIEKTDSINPCRKDIVENLCWLIAIAYDHLHDGRPQWTSSYY